MNFNKLILSIITFVFFLTNVKAQNEADEKLERFHSQKIAFITEQINITSKEAQVFWPVYNEYENKKQLINLERLTVSKRIEVANNNLTEKEATEIADKMVTLQKQESLLLEEYHLKFKKILSSQKVLKLYQAEIQFKRSLLKKLKVSDATNKNRK